MFSSSDVSLSRVGPFLQGKFKPSSLIIFGNLAMFPTVDLGAREKQKGIQEVSLHSIIYSTNIYRVAAGHWEYSSKENR